MSRQTKEAKRQRNGDFTKRERDIRLALFAVLAEKNVDAEEQWKIADAVIDKLRKEAKWL